MIQVCLLCGGESAEHEVSLLSGRSVWQSLSREAFQVSVTCIDKRGVWHYFGDREFADHTEDPLKVCLKEDGEICSLMRTVSGAEIVCLESGRRQPVEVVFPVLHGTNGEDGAVQGYCRMLGLPCVGCDLTSSANCMDKDIAKKLLAASGIRTAPGLVLQDDDPVDEDSIFKELGFPMFIKPAKTGSSVGIHKVKSPEQFQPALRDAFRYDHKVLIEKAIVGREIECAVLEKEDGSLFCADPGEIIVHDEFYSYEAKYVSADGAELSVPARLNEEQKRAVKKIACRAFRVLGGNGFARVDFFLQPDDIWVLNELNTIPGFTSISLYPRLMANSGIPYPKLLSGLIRRALIVEEENRKLLLDAKEYQK